MPRDDVTACPEESSTEDLGQKGSESAGKGSSRSPSQKYLVIPKVARRLSARNAKRKLVSMRATTTLKAKKRRQSFSSSDDFVSREWDRPDSSSEDESEDSDSPADAPHKCRICSRFYKHYKSLKYHLKTHSKRPFDFKCQTCEASFAQKIDLEKHMRTHDGSRPYKCEECGSRFTQSSALKRHERIHANVKPFSCDDCGASFSQNSSLKRHRNSHQQTKPFKCEFCQASFGGKQNLQAHVNSLHGDLPTQKQQHFTCNVCSMTFLWKNNLLTHKKNAHQRSKGHTCTKCSKSFSSKSNLNRHCLQVHPELPEDDAKVDTEKKPFACSACDQRFSRIVGLKLHSRLHNTQNLYYCSLCGKMFAYKQWLRKHMLIHHSSKEHSCEQCGRGFRSLFLLDMHKKLMGGTCTKPKLQTSSRAGHNGWKQMCKYCSKRFALSSRLAKHVRNVHPEAEVFTCDVCDKGFCYYLEYLPHRRTHRHIPYQCKACEVAFPTYKRLLQHRAGHPNPSQKSSLPSTDPSSSIPTVSADAGVPANSSDTIGESDPGKGQDAGNSGGGDENSSTGEVRINKSSTNPGLPVPVSVSLSESLVCQICRLVFLTKLNYQKHSRLVHGEMKYSCQSCDENFDRRKLLDIHTKRRHPKKAGRKKKEKNIKSKIIKPKRAPKYDHARLERLLKACVKRAKERSNKKSLRTKQEKVVKLSMMNYVLD